MFARVNSPVRRGNPFDQPWRSAPSNSHGRPRASQPRPAAILLTKITKKSVHLAQHIRLIREEYVLISVRQSKTPRGWHALSNAFACAPVVASSFASAAARAASSLRGCPVAWGTA
jgi:hypothetical protein